MVGELYTDEDYFVALGDSYKLIRTKYCAKKEFSDCSNCPLCIDDDSCIGTVIGESYRRTKKMLDNRNKEPQEEVKE